MNNNYFRKAFYVFDLLMLGITTISLIHVTANGFRHLWLFLLLDYLLLLRANIAFLLYRREKLTIWPIVAFSVLFGLYFFFGGFENVWLGMDRFTAIAVSQRRSLDIEWLFEAIFVWTWLMPLVVYGFLFFTKKLEKRGTRWTHLVGLAVFHDKAGRMFMVLSGLAFCSYLVGKVMDLGLSCYAMFGLVLGIYYLVNRYIGRKAHWAEYVLLFVAMYAFNRAQYQCNNERVIHLTISAALVMAVCLWLFAKTRRMMLALIVFLALAFVVPSVTLGYNIYCCMDAERFRNCKYTTAAFNDDDEDFGLIYTYSRGHFGIRDRYHELLPCQYSQIKPKTKGWKDVYCITREGDTLVYNLFLRDVQK